MILEIEDIINQKRGFGHVPMPPKTTLGEILSHEKLRGLDKYVADVHLNGARIAEWRALAPQKGDRVRIAIAPRGGIDWAIVGLIATIFSAVASVTMFVMSLFAAPPKPPSQSHRSDSQTYSFEGIRTQIIPGNPIPVVYGQQRVGGQVLSAFVDVKSGGRRQDLSMLIGYGEGLVTNINCLRVNDVAVEDIASVTVVTRLGTTSQAAIPGFDRVRNTFADGREIASGSPIVYSSVTASLTGIQFQVAAQEGLVRVALTGVKQEAYVDYRIERRPTGTTTFSTIVTTKRFTGKAAAPIWDVADFNISTPGAWDFRFTFLGQIHQLVSGPNSGSAKPDESIYDSAGRTKGRIWLTNVTEKEKLTYAFSSIAHVGIRALATSQLHGQLPNVTALVVGKPVLVYSTTAVSTVTWSQIPAWAMVDYMTNSVYGMGAYIRPADIDIQSFIDFATLCRSQVPNGAGGLEEQHHLDLAMDVKKSHWQWLQDIAGLYRSGLIYSQQQWKIVTDRQDLPLRQSFHSGNMVPGKTEIRIGGDPLQPNQANINFANQLLDYERDTIYVQDSASIFGAGDPIKDYDIQAFGVVRESEAIRLAKWDLDRRRSSRREIQFETGLEGIVVEPGDMCRVGIVNTDYEMGWGGRALDGSSRHIVLDREITVQSGYAYDLFVWHIEADTPETRTVATTVPAGTSSFSTVVVSPTSGFNFQVVPNDRWSIGVTSQDLPLCQVKKIARMKGTTQIVAEQYVALSPTTPSEIRPAIDNAPAPAINQAPAQPAGVRVNEFAQTMKDGSNVSNVVIDVAPAYAYEAGRLTVPGTLGSVTLTTASSHNPNADALIGERIEFFSGVASGLAPTIFAYNGAPNFVASIYPPFAAANVPNSGDPYQLIKKQGQYAGVDLYTMATSGGDAATTFNLQGAHYGTEIVIPMASQQSYTAAYKLVPFSDRGVRNDLGTWVVSITTFGDTVPPPQPGSISAIQGTGKDVTVRVYPTSAADLWGHEFFRHTANCFTAATSIGFHSELYHDTNIDFETTYNYWARPRDFSFNVGSWIGPVTFVASRIITTDMASNAVSAIVEFLNNAAISSVLSETVVGSLVITTAGGVVFLIGKADQSDLANNRTGVVALRVGSLAGTLLGQASIDVPGDVTGTAGGTSVIARLHEPVAGTITYILTATQSVGTGGLTVKNRSIQAVELKR